MFYKLVNTYVQRFGFPHRGLKFFMRIMRFLGISGKIYTKKLPEKILIRLRPEEHIQKELFWYGYYEKPVGIILKKMLKPGDVFVDVGANIGYFSLLVANQSSQNKIIALEPVSYLFNALKENISLNKFNNIEALNLAAGYKEETRLIYLSKTDNTGMSSFQQPENYSGKSETVKVVTLDSLARNLKLQKVDLIKIDVEGSELFVLKGMTEIITLFQPSIVLELNPETLSYFSISPADVLTYISHFSYNAFVITDSGNLKKIAPIEITETINLLLIHTAKSGTIFNFSE